jgi:uncharacterized membrane-anchored protein
MPNAVELLNQRNHPQRQALTDEMHVRRFPPFAAPARVFQVVVITTDEPADASWQHAAELLTYYGLHPPAKGKYLNAQLGRLAFSWEKHSEFATYSFIDPGPFSEPFDAPTMADSLPLNWIAEMPGKTLRATQIALLAAHSPEPTESMLASWFSRGELVCCDVMGGEARIWSNFLLNSNGLGRLLIHDRNLVGNGDPSRLVRRLQEIGNYRNMALLGLPAAQHFSPALSLLDRRLAAVSREIATGTVPDQELMQKISQLAADLASLAAETSYRMSATKAYAQLVGDRMSGLNVVRIPGHQTLVDFTERRLTPAVRTCESFSMRTEALSQHAAWASSLMRMRIETALEHQNRDLLDSMNRRAQLQLKLQQTVEGLSVIAISYYAIGILGYVFKAVAHYRPAWDPTLFAGIAAPFVVTGAWLLLRRSHRRLTRSDE